MCPIDSSTDHARTRLVLRQLLYETDRGAALSATALLDECLGEMLAAFLPRVPASERLLSGFNAPLSTFASRIAATHALGLIQKEEFNDLEILRSLRNLFAHSWKAIDFDDPAARELCFKLSSDPPRRYVPSELPRTRFFQAVAVLLSDFEGRPKIIKRERRQLRRWHKTRGIFAWQIIEELGQAGD